MGGGIVVKADKNRPNLCLKDKEGLLNLDHVMQKWSIVGLNFVISQLGICVCYFQIIFQ